MKLYYCPQTRAFTSLWMMEEVGQPYELVRVDIRAPGHPTEAYKKINPMGKVADVTSIATVFRICSFLPAMGLLIAFLPDLRSVEQRK